MLVLTRKLGESIFVGNGITIVVSRISASRVSLGITAPRDISIRRNECEKPLPCPPRGIPPA
jgi:carbon storage regulator